MLNTFVLQKLESTDFDEKKEINKRKQLILEGKVSSVYLAGSCDFPEQN